MTKGAWVTLATNDSYSLGALVLAHSLNRVSTAYPSVVIVTPSVTDAMKERLASVFAEVVTVDVLDSGDAAHLSLLARPELGVTFTKIHCWNLVQYEKCVFLDADTLVLQNSDELFEREELSAAPDVGWPDCFNSGVFVYKPSKETFAALLQFAQERGSFDGGDQGLLNSYFADWARGDSSRRLPFLYNVTSTAFYSYLPALKQFGENMKIIHFIGNLKPWLQSFNWNTRTVSGPSHLEHTLQHWWDIFTSQVHSNLDSAMEDTQPLEIIAPNENINFYRPVINPESEFPWHHEQITDVKKAEDEKKLEEYWSEFHDPWENYKEPQRSTSPFQCHVHDVERNDTDFQNSNSASRVNEESNNTNAGINEHKSEIHTEYEHEDRDKASLSTSQFYPVEAYSKNNVQSKFDQMVSNEPEKKEQKDPYNPEIEKFDKKEHLIRPIDLGNEKKKRKKTKYFSDKITESVPPRHPYDFFYLRHRPLLDARGHKRCSHEKAHPLRKKEKVNIKDNHVSGLAGTFSKINIDANAADEVARRQGWEAGNMDYMGQDSFDKIWAKISQTLAQPPSDEKSISQDTPAVPTQEALQSDTVQSKKEETAPAKPVEEKESKKEETAPAKSVEEKEPSTNVSQEEQAIKDVTEEKPEKVEVVLEIKADIPPNDENKDTKTSESQLQSQIISQTENIVKTPSDSKTEIVDESHLQTQTETAVIEEKQEENASEMKSTEIPPETKIVQTEISTEKSTEQKEVEKSDATSSNLSEAVISSEQTPAPVLEEIKSETKLLDAKPTESSQDQSSASVQLADLSAQSIVEPEEKKPTEKSELVASVEVKGKEDSDVGSLSPPLVATPLTTPEKSSQEDSNTVKETASPHKSADAEPKTASGGAKFLRLNLPSPTTESPRTPDSEFEDAATLAHRIIASEIAKEKCTDSTGSKTAPPVTPPPRGDKPKHGSTTPSTPPLKSSSSTAPVPPPRKKDKKTKK